MTFELEFLDGKRAVPRQLLSYRWSGDVTAGCDGLRLHFLWDGDLPEVYRVRGFAPDGACCFFGYADQHKLTVSPGQRRGLVGVQMLAPGLVGHPLTQAHRELIVAVDAAAGDL